MENEIEIQLRKLGLTEYEIKIYLTLLRSGELKGGMLSKLSNVPHGKTYETIEKLESKGLISIFPSKPKLMNAIKPEIAIKNLTTSKLKEFEDIKKELLPKLEEFKKFKNSQETTSEKIMILRGKKNLPMISNYFYSNSKKYLKILFTYEYTPLENIRLLQDALKRGVEIKQLATKIPEESKNLMKEMISKGIEIRYYPVEELRIIIMDGEESLQQIVNPKNLLDRVSLIIESKDLTGALETYFDKIWKKAKIIKI